MQSSTTSHEVNLSREWNLKWIRKFNENKSHSTHQCHHFQHILINATFALLSKQRSREKKKKKNVNTESVTAIDSITGCGKWQPLPFISDYDNVYAELSTQNVDNDTSQMWMVLKLNCIDSSARNYSRLTRMCFYAEINALDKENCVYISKKSSDFQLFLPRCTTDNTEFPEQTEAKRRERIFKQRMEIHLVSKSRTRGAPSHVYCCRFCVCRCI